MSRRKRWRREPLAEATARRWGGNRKTDPAPPHCRSLAEKLRGLEGEMGEQAQSARMGAALLREHEAHPEAARFLDGIATGISRVTARLKSELDWDECPF